MISGAADLKQTILFKTTSFYYLYSFTKSDGTKSKINIFISPERNIVMLVKMDKA